MELLEMKFEFDFQLWNCLKIELFLSSVILYFFFLYPRNNQEPQKKSEIFEVTPKNSVEVRIFRGNTV